MTTETYTNTELDLLTGASLWLGSLHAAMGSFLDVTAYREDVELAQWLNFLPTEPAAALIEATVLGLNELTARIEVITAAFDAALEITGERIIEEATAPATDEAFDAMMRETFGKDAKRNGG